jgi:acyl-CoA thioester hydrolase
VTARVTSLDLQLRFGDTDALGHVNNAVYASYAELGRIDHLEKIGMPVTGYILARLAMDYRRQVKLGQRCRITTEVERVGTSSVTMKQLVYAEDELACQIEAVVVRFDYANNRPTPISSAERALLGV